MRVLLFSTQWPEYMIELANSLAERAEVALMYPENHRWSEKHRKLLKESVLFLPYKVIFFRSLRQNIEMIWDIYKHINLFKPEIIHLQANGHRWFWLIYLLQLRREVRYVNTIHDPEVHSGDILSKRIKDKWSKCFGKIFTCKYIVHGDKLIKRLAESYNIKRTRITSIPHGHFAIYKNFQEEQVKEEVGSVLFFGRIWRYKGLDTFIKAANLVSSKIPYAKFIIAGTGERIDKYLIEAEDQTRIEVHNYRIPLKEAGKFFQRATVVVLPYKDATQSGIVPVAYAYHKPVIATDVGALSEVIEHGKTGFIVRPEDHEAISDYIIQIIKDQKGREEMAGNIERILKTKLSWDYIAERTMDVYRECLKRS